MDDGIREEGTKMTDKDVDRNIDLLKLNRVLWDFFYEMRERLERKYDEGKRGWDNPDIHAHILSELIADVRYKLFSVSPDYPDGTFDSGRDARLLVDIACRAMMLWNLEIKEGK